MVKFIKKYSNIILDFCIDKIVWFIKQFKKTDFLINHILTYLSFIALYYFKEEFYNSYMSEGQFSLSSVNFIYYSLLYFFIFMILYSWYLIYYVYYIKNKEKRLKKNWYMRFLEDEYKVTYEPLLKWLWFFITLLISWTAIYVTLISMQNSLDIANGKWNWKIDLKNTFEMFKILWKWLVVAIFTFIICFLYYRFSIISKNNYVKKLYYKSYNKKET